MSDPTYYCETNDTAVVVTAATSSPGSNWSLQTLQQAIEIAQSANKPLNILPGTYLASQLTVSSQLEIFGSPGGVIIMSSGSTCVNLNVTANNVTIHGINMWGQNLTFAEPAGGSGSPLPVMGQYGTYISNFNALITANQVQRLLIYDCNIGGSGCCGVALWNCQFSEIRNNRFPGNGVLGVYSTSGWANSICDNEIDTSGDGGILVWQTSSAFDGTIIRGNHIYVANATTTSTSTQVGGSGYFGNAIYCYQADGLVISENVCYQSTFSGIRLFDCNNFNVSNNQIYTSGETALMIEAPYGGTVGQVTQTQFTTTGPTTPHYEGGVVSGNVVVGAGLGINVTNLWQGGRRVTVTGNHVKTINNYTINTSDPNYPTYQTLGVGIGAGGDVAVSNNVVEDCQGPAITVYNTGIQNAALQVVASATSNVVKNAPIGIGFFSLQPEGQGTYNNFTLIQGNIVQGYTQGSIMSILANIDSSGLNTGYSLVDGVDWGRTSSGYAYVGKAYPSVAIGPNYAVGA